MPATVHSPVEPVRLRWRCEITSAIGKGASTEWAVENLKRLLMPLLISRTWERHKATPPPFRSACDWAARADGERAKKKGNNSPDDPGDWVFDLLPSMSLGITAVSEWLVQQLGSPGPPLGLVLMSELLQLPHGPCCHAATWVAIQSFLMVTPFKDSV